MNLSKFPLLIALVGIGALVSGCAQTAVTYPAHHQFLTNVAVIDVVTGEVNEGQTITLEGQQILAVGPANNRFAPPAAQVLIDGGFVVPGLWDMHVHSMTEPAQAVDYFFPMFLANGVTGVRDMGSVVGGIVETRTRLAADPTLLAPQLYVAGPLLDGQKLVWYGDLPLVLKTKEDVERELPKLQAAGMDFFKVYDSLPQEAYDAVIAFGQTNGIPVAGHAPKGVNLTGAGRAGQVTVEHLSPFGFRDCLEDPEGWFQRSINAKFGQGYQAYFSVTQELFAALDQEKCAAAFAAMAQGGTRITPTLVMELNDRSRVPAADLAYLNPQNREWCETGLSGMDQANAELRESVYRDYAEIFQQIRSAGVTVIAGSDVPNNCLVPGFSLHWELARMVEVGMTPLEALQSATLHAAAVMNRSDDVGQVLPGYVADLVVLDANPLQDVANLRRIQAVVTRGQVVDGATRSEMMSRVLSGFEGQVKSTGDRQ